MGREEQPGCHTLEARKCGWKEGKGTEEGGEGEGKRGGVGGKQGGQEEWGEPWGRTLLTLSKHRQV